MTYCMQCGGPLGETAVEGKQRLRCGACGWVLWEDPKVAVAVVVSRGGRVLLGRRGQGLRQGLWSFPAGFVDRGEQLERAAVREVREETGLIVRLGPLLLLRSEDGDPVVLAVYVAEAVEGEPTPGDELTELGWFGRDDAPELAFGHDREVLDAWWRTREARA